MSPTCTIVTACDRHYWWGAYLLIASLRSQGIQAPVHVLGLGLTRERQEILEDFGNVRVFGTQPDEKRVLAVRKPEALQTADSEYIAWMDADCIAVGNIEKNLIPSNGSFQIRKRSFEENHDVFRRLHGADDPMGSIPRAVLEQWRNDVGEREKPAIRTARVANCFVFHRRHMDFIKRWDQQLRKVFPGNVSGVVDHSNYAYSMTDESVLNSLLAYSDSAPRGDDFLLDSDNGAMLAHFGLSPKPWKCWQYSHLRFFDYLMGVLQWVRSNGHFLPELPWSLKQSNFRYARSWAVLEESFRCAKSGIRELKVHWAQRQAEAAFGSPASARFSLE